jgi:hypothetical protein
MGRHALALLGALNTACANAEELASATRQAFDQHPDAKIITSFADLGPLTGARVLAELGDDRSRFAAAKAVKAYAGAAPVARASSKSRHVSHRRIKNQRLATAGYQWAFAALTASPGAHAHYQRRRTAGDAHPAALRNLFNRLGCLHHCLQTRQPYQEHAAFTRPSATNDRHRLDLTAWDVLSPTSLAGRLRGRPGRPRWALDRRHRVDHRLQQHRVVDLGRCQPGGQPNAAPVDQQVVLGAGLAAVGRVRAGQRAPVWRARAARPRSPATSQYDRRGRAGPTAGDAAAASR